MLGLLVVITIITIIILYFLPLSPELLPGLQRAVIVTLGAGYTKYYTHFRTLV